MKYRIKTRWPMLLALTATLAACTHGPGEPDEQQNVLAGSWNWVQSRGGLAYTERTPESEGYAARLEYDATQVRGYRDDRLVAQAHFTVREDSLRLGPLPVYIVEYTPALQLFPFSTLDQHTVHITAKLIVEFDEGCCDRYIHTFTKPYVR